MVTLSALEGLALALAVAGDGPRAGRALGAADALRDGGAHPWDPNVDERDAATAATSALVGEEALHALRREGRAASIDSVVEGLLA